MTPAITIILPFRNAAPTLPACLASVARQTFEEFELLAIDDGSEDASAALVAQAAQRDRRVRLLQPGKVGLVGALNLGLAEARAPLVARMDADDLMHPRRLELQHAHMQAHPALALLATQVALFPQREVRAGYREYVRWQNQVLTPAQVTASIYIESPFAHPSVMLRTNLGGFGLLPGFPHIYRAGPFPEDYELWLRMHAAGLPMAKLPRVLLAWREGAGRASRSDPRYSRESFDALRAQFLAEDPRLHQGRPLVYWGAGRPTRRRARLLIDQGFPPAAWIDIDPDKIGHTVWGAPVRPPDWLAEAAKPLRQHPDGRSVLRPRDTEDRRSKPFVLVYVTNHGARDYIGGLLAQSGYVAGVDYLGVG